MKILWLAVGCVFLACLLFVSSRAAADEWIHLFNGRDLSGWKTNVHARSFQVVELEEGPAIRANCTSPTERSHLFYVDESGELVKFKDFELVAVFRGEPESNSGIFFHTDMSTRDAKLHLDQGYEVNMNNSVKEEQKTGSLYAVVGVNDTSIDDTKWTTLRVSVRDKRIVIHINDKQVVDYTEPDDVKRPVSRSGRLISPDGGAIALQAHDSESVYYFKEVRLRKLPAKTN